ncbi:hypothetical protein GJAV_G00119990 [Gymnothorax javanicus]|nr:hypothetical protein GJAV_G00119990 [Gymnothorax javanicus]
MVVPIAVCLGISLLSVFALIDGSSIDGATDGRLGAAILGKARGAEASIVRANGLRGPPLGINMNNTTRTMAGLFRDHSITITRVSPPVAPNGFPVLGGIILSQSPITRETTTTVSTKEMMDVTDFFMTMLLCNRSKTYSLTWILTMHSNSKL